MDRLAQINRLPDDLLLRILWPDDDGSADRPDSNASFDPLSRLSDDNDDQPTPPPFSDPAHNLTRAAVCRRWRSLAKFRVTSLFVKAFGNVPRQDLFNAVTCFENMTHLILCNGSVETMDDDFLAQVASSRPKLKALHFGYLKAKDKHSITEAGLDLFFKACHQLEQLSLYYLHEDTEYPASFFRLTRLRTLALTNVSALTAPDFAAFSCLGSLRIKVVEMTLQQLSSLAHVPSLTNLSISAAFSQSETDQLPAVFRMAQLPLLKTLKFHISSPNLDMMFPADSPCPRLEQLLFSECDDLKTLPENIGERLPSLRKLTIRSCWDFDRLPETFTSLSVLEELSISVVRFTTLPTDFGFLHALRTLILKSLHISRLPASLCQLQSLETLVITKCDYLRQLPADLYNLTRLSSLTMLNLRIDDGFQELPADLGNLAHLQHLYLHSCSELLRLPDSMTSLSSLESLVIQDCERFSWMPRRLASLEKLKRLEVTDCPELTVQPLSLPPALRELVWTTIGVPSNLSLPSSLCRLELKLASGVFSTRTASLSQLRDLKIYNARRFAVSPWQQLRQLQIVGTERLRELPETISQLQQLTSLTVRAPMLATLPHGLGALMRLLHLDISGCSALQHLPDSLTQLGCLSTLDLSSTAITSFPPGFGRLVRLGTLLLIDCKDLVALPEDLGELKGLGYLDIRGCKQLTSSSLRVLRQIRRGMDGLTVMQ